MSMAIEDVVKSLRYRAEGRRKSGKLLQIDDKMFDLIADDIETAIKREREAAGNAAAVRDCAVDSKFPHGDYEAMKNALERVASKMIYLIDVEGSRVRFQPRAILDDVEHVLKNLGGQMLSDWKETCVKCMDGETEPYHCEYYGEPNGCKSPTYGEHPTCEKSSQVGSAAAMLKALQEIQLVCWKAGGTMGYDVACGIIKAKSHAALSAPPRNCDRQYQNGYDVLRQFTAETGCQIFDTVDVVNWLLAEVKGGAE